MVLSLLNKPAWYPILRPHSQKLSSARSRRSPDPKVCYTPQTAVSHPGKKLLQLSDQGKFVRHVLETNSPVKCAHHNSPNCRMREICKQSTQPLPKVKRNVTVALRPASGLPHKPSRARTAEKSQSILQGIERHPSRCRRGEMDTCAKSQGHRQQIQEVQARSISM